MDATHTSSLKKKMKISFSLEFSIKRSMSNSTRTALEREVTSRPSDGDEMRR